MMDEGDELATTVFTAMAVQISKEAAALAAVLKGDVKSVFITGGLANAKRLTDLISERVSFIAPVHILPGEDELQAIERRCRARFVRRRARSHV
ncbi:MAG: Butyrate kinase [Planctomycetota bacterium]|nr:Butyrate kinase [Planctomycetota bacterium]